MPNMPNKAYMLGNLWWADGKAIQFGYTSNKPYDRPVATIMKHNISLIFITPGSSQRKGGGDVVKVKSEECFCLYRDTYFLTRFSQPISIKNLREHIGELPNFFKRELREKASSVLLRRYGVKLSR